jgi:Flp pilus assembly pilin Flp
LSDESGNTLIEYVLLAALLALLGIGSGFVNLPISNAYSTLGTHLQAQMDNTGGNGNGRGNGGDGNGKGIGNAKH